MEPFAHRRTAATLTVAGPDGAVPAGTPVVVEQVAHAFGVGNIGFDLIALANGEQSAPASAFGGADPAGGRTGTLELPVGPGTAWVTLV